MQRRSTAKWASLAAPMMLLAAGLPAAGLHTAAVLDNNTDRKNPAFFMSVLSDIAVPL